jgi:hypothetical protein
MKSRTIGIRRIRFCGSDLDLGKDRISGIVISRLDRNREAFYLF